jgi:predicted Zn-dependent protease
MKNLLNLLEKYYKPEKITSILQALSLDPGLKKSLMNEDFLSRYLEVNQEHAKAWTATDLAVFAAMYYGEDQQNGMIPDEICALSLAGKKAGQLRPIAGDSSSQKNGITTYLLTEFKEGEDTSLDGLIYAYGLQADPEVYLDAIVQSLPLEQAVSISTRAIIQNELSAQEKQKRFSELLSAKSFMAAEKWISHLNQLSFDDYAEKAAQSWLTYQEKNIPEYMLKLSSMELRALANIYDVAGQADDVERILKYAADRVETEAESIQIKLLLKSSDSSDNRNQLPTWQAFSPSAQVAYILQADLLGAESMEEMLPAVMENPLALIRLSGLFIAQQPEEARQMAINAMRILKQKQMDFQAFLPEGMIQWNPARLIDLLNQVRLPADASNLGRAILKTRPNDVQLRNKLIEAYEMLHQWNDAEIEAKILHFRDPEDPRDLSRLAKIYEKSENWLNANASWQKVMNHSHGTDLEIVEHFMLSAIEAGLPEKALSCCDDTMTDRSNHAGITYYKGKAYLKINDHKNAEKAFLEGTRQCPANENNWLALSQLYQALGKSEKSFEILKTAAVHAPDNVTILVSLANLYLTKKDETTARKILNQAVMQHEVDDHTAILLIENLSALQDQQMIYDYIMALPHPCQNVPKISHYLAQACQGIGKKAEALQAYEQALQGQELEPQWKLNYASALIENGKEVFEANKTIPVANYVKSQQLIKAVRDTGDLLPIEASLLLGEIFLELGQAQDAFAHYQQLTEGLDGVDTNLVVRFQTGLGTSAYLVGDNEIAIAALKAASRDSHHPVFVYQRMAESYKGLHFQEEALQAAKSALAAGPTLIANLAWFAEFAISMDATDAAKEALEVATELAPDDIEYWIAYAVILSKLEDWELFETVIQRIKNFSHMNEKQVLKVADLFLGLGELNNAEAFLLDGLQRFETEGVSQIYLLTLSLLTFHLGNYADATNLLQRLLENRDWDAGLHTLFGDVLVYQGKEKAAAASYDHASKLLEMDEPQNVIFEELSDAVKRFASPERTAYLYQPAAIALRLGSLDIKESKMPEAEERFSSILSSYTDLDEECLYQLFMGTYLIQSERLISELIKLVSDKNLSDGIQTSKLAGLAADIALDNQDSVLAGAFIHPFVERGDPSWRTVAIQSRLLLLNGDWQRAEELFNDLWREVQSTDNKIAAVRTQIGSFYQPIEDKVLQQLSLLKVAVDLRQWSQAEQIMKELEGLELTIPLISTATIMADLEMVEFQRLSSELQIISHAPADSQANEAGFSACMEKLVSIKRWIPSEQFNRLANRIQLVYRPSLQIIRDTVQMVPNQEDLHYLIPAVRRLENCQGVLQLVESARENSDALMNSSLCQIKDHPDAARAGIQAALNLKPNDPVYLSILAQAYIAAGKDIEAYQMLEKAVAIWPDESMWLFKAAELAGKLSDNGNGKKHYAKAYEINPNQPLITQGYVSSLLKDQLYQDAYEILEKSINQHPEDWTLNSLMAQLFEQTGELDHALEEMNLAVDKSHGDAVAKIQLAKLQLKNKSYAEVFNLVSDLPAVPYHDEDILYLRSVALHHLGKPEQAMKLLDGYLSKNTPQTADLLLERAKIIRDMQGERTAIVYVEDILSHYPDSVEGYALISDMHTHCGDLQDTAAYLEKGLKLDSSHAQMNYLNGLLAVKNGNLDLAVHSFAVTIQQNPNRVDAYKALGDTFLRRREFDEAAKIILQGIEINPADLGLILDAAKIYKDSKDYAEAEMMLRKAAALCPEDVNIQRQLGAIIALNLVHKQ